MKQHDRIERQLEALAAMTPLELRAEWFHVFGNGAPRHSTSMLVRNLAYDAQERAFGKLPAEVACKLAALAKENAPLPEPAIELKEGTRLVREWNGRMHSVLVTSDGYEFDGRIHRSLTQIAKRITGTQWSGPRFFGLKRRSPPPKRPVAKMPEVVSAL